MAIKDWDKSERPREKLLHKGAEALSDAELLAIFLRTGTRGKTAIDLARELIQAAGSLNMLLQYDLEQFCQMKGLGMAKFTQIQAALEIAQRYLLNQLEHTNILTKPEQTRQYLLSQLAHEQREVFACIFLDNKNHIITFETLFYGTINTTTVHIREIVKSALRHNAAGIILAHNHPSGNTNPSASDKHLTRQIMQAMQLVDVRVLDHLIIGSNHHTFSFSEHQLI